VAVNIRGRSYTIAADVELTAAAEGVIFAHGAQFGGHALYIKDGKLKYVYDYLGMGAQTVVSDMTVPAGKHALGVEFTKQDSTAQATIGTTNPASWCGRSTATSCCRTSSSAFLEADERASRPQSRTKTRWSRRRDTAGPHAHGRTCLSPQVRNRPNFAPDRFSQPGSHGACVPAGHPAWCSIPDGGCCGSSWVRTREVTNWVMGPSWMCVCGCHSPGAGGA
jgi:hypothetical protein